MNVDEKRKAATIKVGEVELAIMRPTADQNENATMEYNRVFSKCLQSGALLREKLEDFMRVQKLWDDQKEQEYLKLIGRINDGEKQLSQGGIKLAEARGIAIDMRKARAELQHLIAKKNSLDVNTAQGQAEQARFNYLLVECLVYSSDGSRYYQNVSDYLEKQVSGQDNGIGLQAAEKFGNLYYGLDSQFENHLPENRFLKQWKFIDDKLRLVDKQGRTVNENGHLIDDYGRLVNEEGNLVDTKGNPLTEFGDYDFEPKPFLDDSGKPISADAPQETTTEQVAEPVKKRGRKPKVQASS